MFQPAAPAPTGPPIESDSFRISVLPEYMPAHSDPAGSRYVFAYHVLIENVGQEPARLFWRHWRIHDSVVGDHEVEGEGIVGESPRLEPGTEHRYQSFCVLRGKTGHMEGFYHFRRDDGSEFKSVIPRFEFQVPPGDGRTFH